MSYENIDWVNQVIKGDYEAFHDQVCYEYNLFLNYAHIHSDCVSRKNKDYFPFSFYSKFDEIDKPYHLLSYLVEIKDTYVFARTMFIRAQIEEQDFDFMNISWDERLKVFTDYRAGFDLNIEYIKVSLLKAYSVFDKIAFLINEYLRVGIKEKKVNFRSIFNNKLVYNLHSCLHLFALRDIQLDLDEYYNRLCEVRNSITHKYLVTHMLFEPKDIRHPGKKNKNIICDPNEKHSKENPVNYHISANELFDITLRTIKLARSAFIYTVLMIHEKEGTDSKKDVRYRQVTAPTI